MKVGDICTREIVAADYAATLEQAAALMREYHVGALLVTQDTPNGSMAAGVVTDRDLVVLAMARGIAPQQAAVGQLVSGRLVTVPAEASVEEAIDIMQDAGVRRVLVTAADGRLEGIVSLDDLLEALADQVAGLARAVRGGIAREAATRGLPSFEERAVRVPVESG
jgi:CBS domain-containing protein